MSTFPKNVEFASVVLLLSCWASPLLGQSESVKSFTEPYRSIDVAASEMGIISKISVDEGDTVSVGEILGRLNEDVLEASRAIAADTRDARGKLNSALAELRIQKQRHTKLSGLFDRRHASQTELDRAKGQLEIAQAQLETVQDELHVRELEHTRIEAQIEQRRLRSPINGIVTQVFKDEGEFVSANDPNVVTVVQLNPLLVVFMVPQEQAANFEMNQPVELRIGADNVTAQGIVEFVSPTADAQSGTCRVKIKIPNDDLKLPSGNVCYLNSTETTGMAKSQTRKPNLVTSYARKQTQN